MQEIIRTRGIFGGKVLVCFLLTIVFVLAVSPIWLTVLHFYGYFELIMALFVASMLLLILLLVITCKILDKRSLVVTNKRVSACAAFGCRIDIPLEKITGVQLANFNSIIISSPSAKIKLSFCENSIQVFNTVVGEIWPDDKLINYDLV